MSKLITGFANLSQQEMSCAFIYFFFFSFVIRLHQILKTLAPGRFGRDFKRLIFIMQVQNSGPFY